MPVTKPRMDSALLVALPGTDNRASNQAGGAAMVEWSYGANALTASAPEKAKPGSYKELRGTVMDGREGERDFTIRIEVTASVRPTVTVKEDVIPLAVAGGVYEVRPLDNDTSHLLGDKSLTLVDARATGPGGSVTVDQGKGVEIGRAHV